mmetsp:Transcript_38225/g.75247  ORF Transcript_38225/g.75247 Transcript_38225/m.75247 type:complete len:232 (-) Transcript_38225:93-788(-)
MFDEIFNTGWLVDPRKVFGTLKGRCDEQSKILVDRAVQLLDRYQQIVQARRECLVAVCDSLSTLVVASTDDSGDSTSLSDVACGCHQELSLPVLEIVAPRGKDDVKLSVIRRLWTFWNLGYSHIAYWYVVVPLSGQSLLHFETCLFLPLLDAICLFFDLILQLAYPRWFHCLCCFLCFFLLHFGDMGRQVIKRRVTLGNGNRGSREFKNTIHINEEHRGNDGDANYIAQQV